MTASNHQRRSIRLRGYDYSQKGAYFITIVTDNRDTLFGDILNDEMILTTEGEIATQCWLAIPNHHPQVELDLFVVMPNHIHGILLVVGDSESKSVVAGKCRSPSRTIGSIVRGFKIGVTKGIRAIDASKEVWQRNYYEHIIRDEDYLDRIREYILANPRQWQFDKENPAVGANQHSPGKIQPT